MPLVWRDDNGLVNGFIPEGKPCPFADNCGLRMERCPTEDHLLPNPFSCGAARAHSLVLTNKKHKESRA